MWGSVGKNTSDGQLFSRLKCLQPVQRRPMQTRGLSGSSLEDRVSHVSMFAQVWGRTGVPHAKTKVSSKPKAVLGISWSGKRRPRPLGPPFFEHLHIARIIFWGEKRVWIRSANILIPHPRDRDVKTQTNTMLEVFPFQMQIMNHTFAFVFLHLCLSLSRECPDELSAGPLRRTNEKSNRFFTLKSEWAEWFSDETRICLTSQVKCVWSKVPSAAGNDFLQL